MAWTDIARAEHNRDRLRFPSDLTDREWAVVAPMIPAPRRGGRPRTTDMRDVMEAILFIASSGCPWRMLPGDFPPVSTVRGYFYAWRDSGLLATINQLLVIAARARSKASKPSPRPASSTARASRPPKAAGFADMTRARRSKGASATSSPTRSAS